MSGINKVILVGRLGKDPEVKQLDSGTLIANLSLATSETWKDKNTGERKENTQWHNVVVLGNQANFLSQYAQKGSMVYIEGKLKTRKWQDQQGQDRYITEVVCDGIKSTVELLSSNNGNGSQSQQQQAYYQQQDNYQQQRQAPQQQRQQPPQKQAPAYEAYYYDDDTPF